MGQPCFQLVLFGKLEVSSRHVCLSVHSGCVGKDTVLEAAVVVVEGAAFSAFVEVFGVGAIIGGFVTVFVAEGFEGGGDGTLHVVVEDWEERECEDEE